jgi:hypothetical protein
MPASNSVYLVANGGSPIYLSNSLRWVERYQSQAVAQATRRTIGGRHVTFYAGLTTGFPVTLQATEQEGWVPYSAYLSLKALADIPGYGHPDHGTSLVLSFHGTSLDVMFRHEDAPALDLRPLSTKQALSGTDYMIGTLKLITL